MKKKIVIILLAATAMAFMPSTVHAEPNTFHNVRTDNRLLAGASYHFHTILSDVMNNDLEFKTGYTNAKVNFREFDNTDSDIIKALNINTKIEYVDDGSNWIFVRYNDEYGYIKDDYISDTKVKINNNNTNKNENKIPKNHLTKSAGICYYNGRRESYYNLPMEGVVRIMHNAGFNGEYTVRNDGVKTYNNYVMVAADFRAFPRGSIVETSLGTGIVCDTGSFVNTYGANAFDIATAW